MRFMDDDSPHFEEKFHKVRKMIKLYNDYYSQYYSPSWISCLDESMSLLMDFAPGFICIPRKPHPFGNKYQSIYNGDQGCPILWHTEMVEGKDCPK